MNEYMLVKTTVSDQETGEKIASALLEKRLAACVTICAEALSLYWWKGEIARDREYQLIIKTRAALYSKLEAEIIAVHPYEVPEIIALPVQAGNSKYLDWIASETD